MRSRSQVTIVMGDSRALFPQGIPASSGEATWLALAAALNLQYAKAHGYNFEFVHFTGDCTLDLNGTKVKRSHAWCKLLAIQHASLWKNDTAVIWMDSDAIFHRQDWTFYHYLQTQELYLPMSNPLINSSTPVTLSKEDCSVFTFRDYNYPSEAINDTANSGVQFWPQPFDRTLLSEWWSTNVNPTRRQWEQTGLNSYVMQEHPRKVCVLADNDPWWPEPQADPPLEGATQYVWHHSEYVANQWFMDSPNNAEFFPKVFPDLNHLNFNDLMFELQGRIVDLHQDAIDALAASL